MTDDPENQRRDIGRALRKIGELLEDDEKLAQLERTARELRARIERNPGIALDIARELAERFGRSRR